MSSNLIHLFRRTTSGKNFIPELDGLRFIAIFIVVVFHFHFLLVNELAGSVTLDVVQEGISSAGWWLERMDLGVKLFFGISGFILSVPFLKQYWFGGKKVVLRDYFIRRLTRLEPPFIVAILGFLLVHWLLLGTSIVELMPHFIATLFYVHTIVYNAYSPILPVTWSLETEVQFYIAIPFLAYLILRSNSKWKVIGIGFVLFLSSIAFRGYLLRVGIYGMMASLPAFLSHFLVGIGFAYLYLSREKWLRSKNFLWDIFGFLAGFGMFWFYKPQADFIGQVFFNGSVFILFCGAFKGPLLNKIMTLPVVYLIGGMCYTIYLIHLPFFGLWMKISRHFLLGESYSKEFLIQFPLALTCLLLISGIFYLFIEKPCMEKDWYLRFAKKLKLIDSK